MFAIGEWVERKFDGRIGKVLRIDQYDGADLYCVDLDPQRPANEDVWSGSAGAWDSVFRVHGHATSRSRDCDGDYSGGSTYEMTAQERTDQFGDLMFKERVIGSVVTAHGHGNLAVTPDGIEWHEETEEGFHEVSVRWCEDECAGGTPWRRDHRAEAAGY